MTPNRSVLCRTCGKPVPSIMLPDPLDHNHNVTCVNCWEVETRINEYLKSDKGRKLIIEALGQYKDVE
ncbi:hypothetical protein KAW18_11570 [candidate division WOR-3 bacterium]|nr:hypothetical protein [candidate division WOR-3 bacterium]